MTGRTRISASIDDDVAREAQRAAAATPGRSFSAWVSDAMQARLDHERRLAAMADFVADYEREHGEITEQEMAESERRMRESAVVIHGRGGPAVDERNATSAA